MLGAAIAWLILLGTAWLALDFWRTMVYRKQFILALRAAAPEVVDQITLIPSPNGSWNAPSVKRLATKFQDLGFIAFGVYQPAEMRGLEIYPMVHNTSRAFAIIYRLVDSELAWFDISGWYESGEGVTVSSSYYVPNTAGRPGQTKRVFMNVAPKIAVAIFRREVGRQKLKALQPDQFVETFEREYAADARYRIEQASSVL